MAFSAPWPEPDQALPQHPVGLADRQRRRQAFEAAHRHSRIVRRLRLLLPLAGATAILGFVVATRLSLPVGLDLAGARLSVTRNAIIMDNPHLTGFDRSNRQYAVSADRAIQALTNPDAVRLEAVRAKLSMPSNGTAEITAQSGDYDRKQDTLKLHGAIAVNSSEGYALTMTEADIALGAGTMTSPNPVSVTYQDSKTIGDSISVSKGGQVIELQGGVRTTLMPPKRTAAPPAAPAARKD